MYFSSEQQVRAAAFDRYVFRARSVLDRPAVVQALGAYAAPLKAVSEQVFLPNVRHGKVEITQQQKDSDAIPLLPITPEETGKTFYLSNDFLWPAKSSIQALYAENPGAAKGLCETIPAGDTKRVLSNPSSYAYVTSRQRFVYGNREIKSRPLIVTTTGLEREPIDLPVGSIMLHEYTHVLQELYPRYRRQAQYEAWDWASGELEANWVGFAAMEAVGLSLEQIWQHNPVTYNMEMYRRTEANPRNPFVATENMVAYLKANYEDARAHSQLLT